VRVGKVQGGYREGREGREGTVRVQRGYWEGSEATGKVPGGYSEGRESKGRVGRVQGVYRVDTRRVQGW